MRILGPHNKKYSALLLSFFVISHTVAGSWSVEGCMIISSQDEDVVRCSCNHLTHFAWISFCE